MQMRRRKLAAAMMLTPLTSANAQDWLGALQNQLNALLKNQPSTVPVLQKTGAQFEDGVPLSTYEAAYKKRFKYPDGYAIESPIRGLGLIRTPAGHESIFLNSDASFFGARKWFEVSNATGKSEELPFAEQLRIRSEILRRIRWDLLVGPVWGAGAPQKALVYSALDCPACVAMERELIASEGKLRYELYYLPLMLNKNSSVARQVWCASSRPAAWRQAMLRQPIDSRTGCDLEYYTNALGDALAIGESLGDGRVLVTTPTIILDSGERGSWTDMKVKMLAS